MFIVAVHNTLMATPCGFVKYFSCYFTTLLRKLGCGISYSLESMHAEDITI